MWSRMPGCPVMTKFCCRWSTTPARPRPSSRCWWTSKILQFPLDQPCRCSSTLRPECFQWLSWIGVERILWVFWCWNERAHAFKFRPGNPNLYICCALGQDSSNTVFHISGMSWAQSSIPRLELCTTPLRGRHSSNSIQRRLTRYLTITSTMAFFG